MKKQHYIMLTISFQREGALWIAQCKELGTAIQADTLDEATEIIREAILAHLNVLEEEKESENFFEENGIEVFDANPPKTVRVNVPENSGIFLQPLSVPVPA